MDKVRELEDRLEETIREHLDLTEVGFDEIDNYWKKIDEIKNEANQVVADLIVGATRDENGKFVAKNNITFDIDEIAAITTKIKEITDLAYQRISESSAVARGKRDLFAQKFSRRREVKQLIAMNESMVNTLETDIKSIKSQLGDPGLTQEMIEELAKRGIEYKPSPSNLTPEKRFYLENELKAKEASLATFVSATQMYKEEQEKLTTDMGILKHGGKIEEPEEEKKDEEERTNEDKKGKEEEGPKPFPNFENNGEGTGNQDEEDKKDDTIPLPIPPRPIIDETDNDLGKGEDEPKPFPDFDNEGEGTGNQDEEEQKGDTKVVPVPIPPRPEIEEENDLDQDDELKDEMQEGERYKKKKTPAALWKRVGAAIAGAITFLAILGTAHHTGHMMADNRQFQADVLEAINNVGQVQVDGSENPNPDPEPEPEPTPTPPNPTDEEVKGGGKTDPKPAPNPTPTPTPTPDPMPTPNPNPTPDPTPTPEPTPTPNPNPTPNPDPTPDPNPTPDPEPTPDPDKQDDNMYLSPGDVGYNSANGTYVDSEGNTHRINKDGTISDLGKQELDHNNKGESVVGEDNLNPEEPKEMPVIGNVTTGADMTDEEIKDMDDMINSGKNPEDLVDKSKSEASAEPATAEDYTKAEENKSSYEEATNEQFNNWWEDLTSKLSPVNDEGPSMSR